MSRTLFWQTQGQGCDLVLIHGWGMNGAAFEQVSQELGKYFTLHIVDLPGYGFSQAVDVENFEQLCASVLENAPEKAVYVGWSLGGLVATQIALTQPQRVSHLVSLASSPKFVADESWQGIDPAVLADFSTQLKADFQKTVEGFMALQVMGSPSARQDIRQIKQAVFSRPMPNPKALSLGLDCLAQVDLRAQLSELQMPFLRLYGRLDRLVPRQCAKAVLEYAPQSQAHVFKASSHAPFMTESDLFVQTLREFCQNL
ncbi:MAG: pimeloyl-ACP methyl ester esterase BioH [Vibrio sp.]